MLTRVILLGGGGHAKVLLDAICAAGSEVYGFVDPDPNATLGDLRHLGGDDAVLALDADEVFLVNGLGSVTTTAPRRALHERLATAGYRFSAVVHPAATVADDVEIAPGAQVMAGAVVQTGARVGVDAIVNTAASVDHDTVVGDFAHVAPGATLCGGVQVGDGAHVGAGAVVVQDVVIGSGAFVAAGAVVVADVAAGARVRGVPAREWNA